MGKLTKAQIRETLDKTPIDTILMGKSGKLTAKQRNFARGVAKGLTQSDAYRLAYDTKAKPAIVHRDACVLAKNPKVAKMIEAYRVAEEAREYHSPTRLRELVINTLVMHAIDDDIKPAQRLKATELLGKLTEVGSFTERKETTVIHESGKLREKLLDQIKTIVSEEGSPIGEDEGDRLMKELMGYRVANHETQEPTHEGAPEIDSDHPESYTHINPHTQSGPKNEETTDAIHEVLEKSNENNEMLTVNVYSEDFVEKKEGVGGEEIPDGGWVEKK